MIILAKAIKGEEFFYNAKTAHQVSKAKADLICKALNDNGYDLKEGECWYRYDVGQYDMGYLYGETQAFKVYKGTLKEVRR